MFLTKRNTKHPNIHFNLFLYTQYTYLHIFYINTNRIFLFLSIFFQNKPFLINYSLYYSTLYEKIYKNSSPKAAVYMLC